MIFLFDFKVCIFCLFLMACATKPVYYEIQNISSAEQKAPHSLGAQVTLSKNGGNKIWFWDICVYEKYFLFRDNGEGYKKISSIESAVRQNTCESKQILDSDGATIYSRYLIANMEDIENDKAVQVPIYYLTTDVSVRDSLSKK